MPKKKTPEKKTVKLPAYFGEPDKILLEKVAGKIGEYDIDVMVGWRLQCYCNGLVETKELGDKIEKLTDLVNAKFGEITKILSALKKPK